MTDVLVVGSVCIDMFVDTQDKLFSPKKKDFPFGEKILLSGVKVKVGGGAYNVASDMHCMQVKPLLVTKVGCGSNGHLVERDFKAKGLSTRGLVKDTGCDDNTGLSVILDAKGHDRTILVTKGVNDLLHASELPKFSTKIPYVFLTSMLGESLKTEIAVAKKMSPHSLVIYNPSHYVVAAGRKKIDPLLKHVDVLFFNKEEAQILLGASKRTSIKSLLKQLKDIISTFVIITDGAKGVFAYDGQTFYHVAPDPNVKVVETTGAGDAFGAGFTSALVHGVPQEQALCYGVALSQDVISHVGAQANTTWSKIESYVKKSMKNGHLMLKEL